MSALKKNIKAESHIEEQEGGMEEEEGRGRAGEKET